MIYQNVGLHNVVELQDAPGGGVLLQRFPRAVREALSPLGRMVSQESAGAELRFVTEAESFRLDISSLPSVLAPWELHNQDLFIFRGPFVHSHHRLTPGRINPINVVNIPGTNPFDSLRPGSRHGCGFSSRVWRVMFGRYAAIFHGLDTYGFSYRPPQPEEVPAQRWLAYGSSITHGASPTVHLNAYIYHAARLANLDVLNHGLSGSCLCEPEMATYLAQRRDWDIITLELGVNMRGAFEPSQFRERVHDLVSQLRQQQPHKRIVLISIYPNSASTQHAIDGTDGRTVREQAFNTILRELAARHAIPLIDGAQVLDSLGDTTVDLVHPSDYGHAHMGQNLGAFLKSLALAPETGHA